MRVLFLVVAASALSLFGATDACAESEKHRAAVSKKMALLAEMIDATPQCMAMCKEVGACPVPAGEDVDCNCFGCSGFDKDAYASANDGIMTWPELLDKMGNLGDKWEDAIKTWVKDYTL